MKAKHLVPLVIICVAATVIGALVLKRSGQLWGTAGGEEIVDIDKNALLLPDFPINDIAHIVITAKQNTVELAKKDGTWRCLDLFDYPADFAKIKTMLRIIADLEAGHILEVGEKRYERLGVNVPDKGESAGTLLQFHDKTDGIVGSIVLGNTKTRESGGPYGPRPVGRYVRVNKTVSLVTETFWSVQETNDQWVDKEFCEIDELKRAVAYDGDTEVWRIERDDKGSLLDYKAPVPEGRELDAGKLSQVGNALRRPSFKSIADPAASDEDLGLANARRVVIEGFDGFNYTLLVGAKNEEGDHAVRVIVGNYNEPPAPEPPADESPGDKAERQKAYDKSAKDAAARYERQKARFVQWPFIVNSYSIDELLYQPDDFLKALEDKDEAEGDAGAGVDAVPSFTPPALPELPEPVPNAVVDAATRKILEKAQGQDEATLPVRLPTGSRDQRINAYMEIAKAGNGQQLGKLLGKVAAKPEVIGEILEGISRSKNSNMSHIVRPYMKNDAAQVRAAAVMALGMIGDQSDRERLQVLADDGDTTVQMAAKAAVTEISQRLKQGEEGWKE
ncbi:MAG: DUF4340 domain-containing protein [Lentisphaeria bacterium]|nr:DUF4340 domain-containing protein [Lentisphaeria bacterium]MDP7741217.1 DUF4340 domain-containing protein [Lentisphaeria bacterium]